MKNAHRVEVTTNLVGVTLHSKAETPDMYESIDAVAHALVRTGKFVKITRRRRILEIERMVVCYYRPISWSTSECVSSTILDLLCGRRCVVVLRVCVGRNMIAPKNTRHISIYIYIYIYY